MKPINIVLRGTLILFSVLAQAQISASVEENSGIEILVLVSERIEHLKISKDTSGLKGAHSENDILEKIASKIEEGKLRAEHQSNQVLSEEFDGTDVFNFSHDDENSKYLKECSKPKFIVDDMTVAQKTAYFKDCDCRKSATYRDPFRENIRYYCPELSFKRR